MVEEVVEEVEDDERLELSEISAASDARIVPIRNGEERSLEVARMDESYATIGGVEWRLTHCCPDGTVGGW